MWVRSRAAKELWIMEEGTGDAGAKCDLRIEMREQAGVYMMKGQASRLNALESARQAESWKELCCERYFVFYQKGCNEKCQSSAHHHDMAEDGGYARAPGCLACRIRLVTQQE